MSDYRPLREQFAEVLLDEMDRQHLRQVDVAHRSGYSQTQISCMILGTRNSTLPVWEDVLQSVGVQIQISRKKD